MPRETSARTRSGPAKRGCPRRGRRPVPRAHRYRTYSDTFRAEALGALDVNRGNMLRTARELGIPRVTLLEWDRGRTSGEVSKFRQFEAHRLADRLEEMAVEMIEKVPGKIEGAPLRDVSQGLSIVVDWLVRLREKEA